MAYYRQKEEEFAILAYDTYVDAVQTNYYKKHGTIPREPEFPPFYELESEEKEVWFSVAESIVDKCERDFTENLLGRLKEDY